MPSPATPSKTAIVRALRADFEDWMRDAAQPLGAAGFLREAVPAASRVTVAQFEATLESGARCALSLLLAHVETASGTHDALTWLAASPDSSGEDCIFIQELCRLEGREGERSLREALLSAEPRSVLTWVSHELSTAGLGRLPA